MGRQVLSLLVENTPGVVSRISGLFSRRGFNIEGFSAGVTADIRFTRVTVVAEGNDKEIEQIEKQLFKLEDVVDLKKLEPDNAVIRELILVKLRVREEDRQAIINMTNIYRAKIVNMTPDSMIIELSGTLTKNDAFLELVKPYEILELARTGVTGLSRTTADVKMFD